MSESINNIKLHQELKEAGLPVVSVSASGRVDYSRSLTAGEKSTAQAIFDAHDPTVPDRQVFFEKLTQAGFTRDDVLYALWKKVVDLDDSYIETILIHNS